MRPNVRKIVVSSSALASLIALLALCGTAVGFTTHSQRPHLSDLSISTNLWRSEFVLEAAEEKESPEGTDGAADQSSGPSEVPAGTNDRIRHAKVVGLEELLLDSQGTTIETKPSGYDDLVQGDNQASLSDWEKAATRSAGGIGVGATSSGPSIISMVVGVVGIMIVVGAYCSSSSRA